MGSVIDQHRVFNISSGPGVGSARAKDLALLNDICVFTTLGKPIPKSWEWQNCPEGAASGLTQQRTVASCPAPMLIHGLCFPVPFPGVKQEQLSPRSQASQPESLVLQPSQEGSILRGEHPGREARAPALGREGGREGCWYCQAC